MHGFMVGDMQAGVQEISHVSTVDYQFESDTKLLLHRTGATVRFSTQTILTHLLVLQIVFLIFMFSNPFLMQESTGRSHGFIITQVPASNDGETN